MSDDGWGESTTPAAKPTTATSGLGGQSGFGSAGFSANKNASGDAPPTAGGFGNQSKGFSSIPAAAPAEKKGFGGGGGFGSSSTAAPPEKKGFGGGGGFGSSSTAAPPEKKGFGGGGGFGSSSTAAPAEKKGFGGGGGFGSSSTAAPAEKKGFGGGSFGSSSTAAPAEKKGFGAPAAEKPAGFGSTAPAPAQTGFAKPAASIGFGKSSGGFNAAAPSGAGGASDAEKKPAGFGGGKGFGAGSGFGAAAGGTGFGAATGGTGFGAASGGSGFGGGGDAGGRPRGCFNCGEEGHRSADCPQPKKERSSACFNCGEEGHRSSDCTQPKKERANGSCFNCGLEGHSKADCPEPPKPREDGAKPASTFIPPEESPDTLYHSGVEKGALFERFYDAPVTTMHGGLDEQKALLFQAFQDLGLGAQMMQNIVQCGYTKPTPVQQHAMPIIMAGHDLLACAQTGSGKTAAFLLPIMSKLHKDSDHSSSADIICSPRCLVIAPTRELAVQISNEARKFAFGTMMTCRVVYGGTHVGHQRNQLMQGATIVVGTIGRLKQFIDDGTISLKEIRYLVLDEADRMLEMGFSEEINSIVSGMPDKSSRQTLMFSATFPTEVQMTAGNLLKENYVMFTVDAIGTANKCITQELVKCDRQEKKDKLLGLLEIDKQKYTVSKQADVFTKKTLIFVSKKAFADALGAIVSVAGIPTTTIHGDRLQNERHEALTDFASGRKAILIATAVAERGLDIKGVDHVINYDLPEEMDSYIHRIGRTGRVGNSGRATSFYTPSIDQKLAGGLLKCMEDAGQVVPDWLKAEAAGSGDDVTTGFGGRNDFGAPAATAGNDEEDW